LKRQVNLFSVSLLPVKPVLPLPLLLWLLLTVVLLTAAMLVTQRYYTAQQQQVLQVLQQQQQQLQGQAELLQQGLLQRTPDASLVQQQQNLQQQLQRQQAMLQFLGGRQQQTGQFSAVFAHLQKIDQPQLWLQRFVLQPKRSSWHGFTTQPSAIAVWLEALGQLPQLKGQQFQQIELQQAENSNIVQFSLQAQDEAAL